MALNADGTVSLGGDETIGDLSGSGIIANNGNNLTVNQTSNQGFTGNITGAGGLTKQGEAGLTLTNGSDFTEPDNARTNAQSAHTPWLGTMTHKPRQEQRQLATSFGQLAQQHRPPHWHHPQYVHAAPNHAKLQ